MQIEIKTTNKYQNRNGKSQKIEIIERDRKKKRWEKVIPEWFF